MCLFTSTSICIANEITKLNSCPIKKQKANYSRIYKSNYIDIKVYLIILTSLIFRDIDIYIPFFVIFENLVTSFAFMTAAAMLVVFPCMDYSSLYFLKNVFTFTTTKINFVSLDLILAIDFFPQNIVIQLVSCFCSFLIRLPCCISLLLRFLLH